MTTIDIVLPAPHPKQREFELNARRFNLLNCGRRFGKDIELQRRIIRKALHTRKPVAWFAPTYKMLKENWRELRGLLAPVTARASESEHRLDLFTGNAVEMWSLDNPDAPRGRKYAYMAVNEAALIKDLEMTWNMVLRPTLADFRGEADFGSTPRGLNGFYSLWQRAADDPDWARFHYRTDDNPYIPPSEIAAMRASLPERVIRQEIDAEFVEDGSYFQKVDDAAVIEEADKPETHWQHYIVAGLDWAMKEDYTVLTIACRDCNRVIYWDRFNQINYQYQRERIINSCHTYNVGAILPERNSIGQPNIELLEAAGIPVLTGPDSYPGFNTTATTKPALIQKLAAALEHDGFQVPVDYADELRSYEVELSASGHNHFSAPAGMHDDRVISLALAWWAMTADTRIVETGANPLSDYRG